MFKVIKKLFILAVLYVSCVCGETNLFWNMSTTEMDDSKSMNVTSDSDTCENEDTGLNETISNINFDPGNE